MSEEQEKSIKLKMGEGLEIESICSQLPLQLLEHLGGHTRGTHTSCISLELEDFYVIVGVCRHSPFTQARLHRWIHSHPPAYSSLCNRVTRSVSNNTVRPNRKMKYDEGKPLTETEGGPLSKVVLSTPQQSMRGG